MALPPARTCFSKPVNWMKVLVMKMMVVAVVVVTKAAAASAAAASRDGGGGRCSLHFHND